MGKSAFLSRATALFTVGIVMTAQYASYIMPANAASLTTVAISQSNEATSATGNAITITFTPATAITTGSIIEVTYDTAFTATLADADVTVTGTNITSSAESDFAAGYFRSTLTTTGSVSTTVTIAIDNTPGFTNPALAGNYPFSLSVNIGGAGTTYDYGAGLAYVGNDNDVTVSAVVPPTIDMELYQTGSDTELADPNSCSLGVLTLSSVKSCAYDIGFATNTAAGVTVRAVRDGAMDDGSGNDINAVADTAVTAGAEEYGFRITDIGTGCTATASGTYGSQDNAVPSSVTTIFTTAAVCNGTTAGQSAKRAEITHRASMDASTVVGSYNQVVTYTAFTN